MGKKGLGRKAFVKSTMVRAADDDVEDPKASTIPESPAPDALAATHSTPNVDVSGIVDKAAKFRIAVEQPSTSDTTDGIDSASKPQNDVDIAGEEDSKPGETRGQIVQRHKMVH
jgi:hypothetical protein